MMRTEPPQAIVRGGHINNRSGRGRTYAKVRGLIQYITYGRYQDQPGFGLDRKPDETPEPRGVWLDHRGRAIREDEVRQWAKDKVHRYDYDNSYQLLLSTRHGGLTAEDFNQVMQEASDISGVYEWRAMLHDDTEHQHAHVILFRREKLTQAEYKEWQQTMQAELERLQNQRVQEQQLQVEMTLEPAPEREVNQGWEIGV